MLLASSIHVKSHASLHATQYLSVLFRHSTATVLSSHKVKLSLAAKESRYECNV